MSAAGAGSAMDATIANARAATGTSRRTSSAWSRGCAGSTAIRRRYCDSAASTSAAGGSRRLRPWGEPLHAGKPAGQLGQRLELLVIAVERVEHELVRARRDQAPQLVRAALGRAAHRHAVG